MLGVDELCDLIRGGLEYVDGLHGTCQVRVGGTAPLAVFASFDESGARVLAGTCAAPDSELDLSQALLRRVVAEARSIDFRDPEVARHSTIRGDPTLARTVARSLLRPSSRVVATFARAATLTRQMPPLEEIPRLRRPAAGDLRTFIRGARPVILTGCLDSWLTVAGNAAELKSHFGTEALTLPSMSGSHTVGSFVDLMKSAMTAERFAPVYTRGAPLPQSMQSRFEPPYFHTRDFTMAQMWLGVAPPGALVTGLHRDASAGFLGQVLGRKKLLLCPPHHEEFVYPVKAFNAAQPCRVNPEQPDYERFPAFRNARFVEAELAPGEMLVTPPGWFHCVYALDIEILSISYFLVSG